MTMSIGGVDIPLDEQPDRGSYPFWRSRRIVRHPILSGIGSVQQDMGTDPLMFTQHFTLSPATMAALQALYATAAGPYTYIQTDLPEPYITGFEVTMLEPKVEVNEQNRGFPWYDVAISFEEVYS